MTCFRFYLGLPALGFHSNKQKKKNHKKTPVLEKPFPLFQHHSLNTHTHNTHEMSLLKSSRFREKEKICHV